ncbi:MAG: hypothetical protein IKO16_10990 [Lachnospiraceae bacterium]|nr:hypothetical protein [Lachnospiraceae bacterium]
MEELDNTPEEIAEDSVSEEESVKEHHSNYPTQAVLTIRAIVGIYVTYLAYQIITSDSEVTAWMWAAVGLFIVAGVGLVVMSVKHFICGEYVGGKKDV